MASATSRTPRSAAGFTLIEIMVVIVIVGVVLSIATLSLGLLSSDRDLRTEAQRFIALAGVAQDEATLQGREYGIELLNGGYRFVEYDGGTGQWSDILGDETLRLRELSDGLAFELFLEAKRVLLDEDPASFDVDEETNFLGKETYSPHLLIYSSGDTTPFELHLMRDIDDSLIVMRGNALGAIEIVNPDEI